MTEHYTKDPSASLDYRFDWSKWLDTGETIASFLVTPETGLTLDLSEEANGIVTAWLSGGNLGTSYKVTCHIETSNITPRIDERTINIRIQER